MASELSRGNNEKDMENGRGSLKQSVVPQSSISEFESHNPGPKAFALDHRVKRKAKRPSKFMNAERGHAGNVINVNGSYIRYTKNSRKSRNGFGRGLPKKGGAGGKGTWGKPGSELMLEQDDILQDIHDPNYDFENQDDCKFEAIAPELTAEDFEKTVTPVIREYLEHGDTQEVIDDLQDLNFGKLRPQIVSTSITLAMEHKPSHREMVSVLLSDMYGQLVLQEHISSGFSILLDNLPDLVLDTPDAPFILGNFIARAVADDCLPPKFVQDNRDNMECQCAREALERAYALLNMKHGLVRLDNVWGVGGGMRPVIYLTKQIFLLLKEYLSSGDTDEACRCIQELEVPHFHHELIYELIVMVIEDMNDRSMDVMCKLLQVLASSVIVTPDQMTRGFIRVYDEMPDISIDVPQAYGVLEKFVKMCHDNGFISDEITQKFPFRGRKRFVSEGDGGMVKSDVQ